MTATANQWMAQRVWFLINLRSPHHSMNSFTIGSRFCALAFALVLTAVAHADVYSPEGRHSEAFEGSQRFKRFSDRENSKDPIEAEWWREQNSINIARTTSVACEQTFLLEAKSPKSTYAKSLELCSKYEVKFFSSDRPGMEESVALGNQTIAGWASIMRYYTVMSLLKTKDFDKAIQEFRGYDAYVDAHLKWKKSYNIYTNMLGITIAALRLREEAARAVALAVAEIQPAARAEFLARSVKLETDRLEANTRTFTAEDGKRLRESMESIKEAEEARAQRDNESNQARSNTSSDQGANGECECTRQEQVWVPNYSGSGAVKSVRGHYEFKMVKYPCPCK